MEQEKKRSGLDGDYLGTKVGRTMTFGFSSSSDSSSSESVSYSDSSPVAVAVTVGPGLATVPGFRKVGRAEG
jgi:hypothetical protein